jgi:hypothetical protein
MKIYQSKSFENKVKKFTLIRKTFLDSEIREIISAPSIGVEKRGDLKGIFIPKFKIKAALYLLSYRFVADGIELITIGPHENYYRGLKNYLKNK